MPAGAWQARIQWRGKGDDAVRNADYTRAIECYQQVQIVHPPNIADQIPPPPKGFLWQLFFKMRLIAGAQSGPGNDGGLSRLPTAGWSVLTLPFAPPPCGVSLLLYSNLQFLQFS